jgi:hypothetical protein
LAHKVNKQTQLALQLKYDINRDKKTVRLGLERVHDEKCTVKTKVDQKGKFTLMGKYRWVFLSE